MRILDRERCWDFFKAYFICFFSLVCLYVVIDAFTNLDEFTEVSPSVLGAVARMARYYSVRTSVFYDQLCGVITMMAAIFTVTWLQKNNQLLAMLAAGISAKRVIVPVFVGAGFAAILAILNQEIVMPRFAEELQRTPDMNAGQKLRVWSRHDVNDILIHGTDGYEAFQTIEPFHATLPVSRFGALLTLEAVEARYVPDTDQTSPLRGGWVLYGARLIPGDAAVDAGILKTVEAELMAKLPPPRMPHRVADGESMFLRTNISFTTLTRGQSWFAFAPTPALLEALRDPTSENERTRIAVFLHARLIRPVLSITLLFLSLPLVMSGDKRNMFINLGLSLGTALVVYGTTFFMQYLGNSRVLTPEQAAWTPLILFGTLAAWRWDRIRT
jgi:lipopolysaccharide export system permease protein